MNELYRVLKPGAKCYIEVPHWCSGRAFGDLTHQWPPVSEWWFYYLRREWRRTDAPHTYSSNMEGGYSCDFDCTWGYKLHPLLVNRNEEYRQHAMAFFKEALMDMVATMISNKKP